MFYWVFLDRFHPFLGEFFVFFIEEPERKLVFHSFRIICFPTRFFYDVAIFYLALRDLSLLVPLIQRN